MIAYDEGGVVVRLGDCRDVLATLPDASVQTVVTSPPYYGLRSYLPEDHPDKALEIGLESTVATYVAEMVGVFREVRRVLADDGTLWLNLGDSYAAGKTGRTDAGRNFGGGGNREGSGNPGGGQSRPVAAGLKHKDLIGIPWRVAFALQADGWILRQDIILSKPNPMPESVTDRCTKAHEYLFLLSKSPRYYFDADAIAEDAKTFGRLRSKYNGESVVDTKARGFGTTAGTPSQRRNRRTVWEIAPEGFDDAHFATFPRKLVEPCVLAGSRPGDVVLDPFAGSGTTLQVSKHLGRRAVGIELNPDYLPMIERRLQQAVLPLGDAA